MLDNVYLDKQMCISNVHLKQLTNTCFCHTNQIVRQIAEQSSRGTKMPDLKIERKQSDFTFCFRHELRAQQCHIIINAVTHNWSNGNISQLMARTINWQHKSWQPALGTKLKKHGNAINTKRSTSFACTDLNTCLCTRCSLRSVNLSVWRVTTPKGI